MIQFHLSKPLTIAGVAIVAAASFAAAWSWNAPVRFPDPSMPGRSVNDPTRPSSPRTPSIPSLKRGVATQLPGLEAEENCYSICLTPDLRHIFFGKAVTSNGTTSFDLYTASRNNVTSKFAAAEPISSTATAENEVFPAVTLDGLELFFVRSDAHPVIWVTRRPDLNTPFGSPEEWTYATLDDQTSRVGTPQCISAKEIVFSRIDVTTGVRTIWSCIRNQQDQFSRPALYAAPAGAPTFFFNVDGRRGYYPSIDNGIYASWRPTRDLPFGTPLQLLDGERTGPIDGTVWVAPHEDVLFYCSPGPGKKLDSPRGLWMIAF